MKILFIPICVFCLISLGCANKRTYPINKEFKTTSFFYILPVHDKKHIACRVSGCDFVNSTTLGYREKRKKQAVKVPVGSKILVHSRVDYDHFGVGRQSLYIAQIMPDGKKFYHHGGNVPWNMDLNTHKKIESPER